MAIELYFDRGTLVAPALDEAAQRAAPELVLDVRAGVYRAPARAYRDVVLNLKQAGIECHDRAKRWQPLTLSLAQPFVPFPHQAQALERWQAAGQRGIVELPTGAGKTLLAVLAIAHCQRPALILVPTIDLLAQWRDVLAQRLGVPIGMIGGGSHVIEAITVSTYDSAANQIEFLGDRFGLLIADECHHLPAPAYRFIATGSLAPFRLGLTATLERADGLHSVAADLLGPLVHSVPIDALEGQYLAPYEVRPVPVRLTAEEQAAYDTDRARYLAFLRKAGVRFDRPNGWADFLIKAHRTPEGREAFKAYRRQRRIALSSTAKLQALWQVLVAHRDDRVIVFAEDNETVYGLAERFFLPAISHHTPAAERSWLLAAFARGELKVLITAKVLNEGVDVPEANVGVVLAGSGSVREHVQRLGRILRKRPGKEAVLYEITTETEAEAGISERRRQHRAYQKVDEPC